MAKKTIKLPATLHVVDADKTSFDKAGKPVGDIVVKTVAPMTPVEIDADEADRLLALHAARGAVEHDAKAAAAPVDAPPPVKASAKD